MNYFVTGIQHLMVQHNFKKLEKEPNTVERKLRESAIISLNEDGCLSDCSINFNACRFEILKEGVLNNKINMV